MESATTPAAKKPPALLPADVPIVSAGKFFRRGEKKWVLKGVTYGPFEPRSSDGAPFPEHHVALADLDRICSLGFNTIRTYHAPPRPLCYACHARGLKILLTVPWTDHMDLFDGSGRDQDALDAVAAAAAEFRNHPARLGYLVGNEIDSTLVRWMGPARVQRFIESLISAGRRVDPNGLFAYASYPTTEFISPNNADFVAFNIYLEDPAALASYLARLQVLAGDKPLVVSEFGADGKSLGSERQAEIIRMGLAECARAGTAGEVIFAYTDEWHRSGQNITGWDFGVVTRNRESKPASNALSPRPPRPPALTNPPKVSVIVCSYNGESTLPACLRSLKDLHYPDYEVIVVDDGSTDSTPDIARAAPGVRYVRQDSAGLSAARNRGASEATGKILAYTDDDCMADPDWLAYLAPLFESGEFVAAGGPNIPPPPRNSDEACVSRAPGAPAHVLISDTEAEHIPGCNLAVDAEAFERIGGFREEYMTAGDDVDFCWRLEEAGGRIGFAPAAMVWHHRRARILNYLRQQAGYGKAEAILISQHRSRFGIVGGARWKGIVYGPSRQRLEDGIIYAGRFGFAPFQAVYPQPKSAVDQVATGIPWAVSIVALTLCGIFFPPLFIAAAAMVTLTVALSLGHAFTAEFPDGYGWTKDRFLLAGLYLLQPIVRGWARYLHLFRLRSVPGIGFGVLFAGLHLPRFPFSWSRASTQFWSPEFVDRTAWLTAFRAKLDAASLFYHLDDGWRPFDIEVQSTLGTRVRIYSVSEHHAAGCLTRTRYTAHPAAALPLLTAAAALTAVATLSLPPIVPLVAAASAATLATLTWLSARISISRIRKLAAAAAKEISLAETQEKAERSPR